MHRLLCCPHHHCLCFDHHHHCQPSLLSTSPKVSLQFTVFNTSTGVFHGTSMSISLMLALLQCPVCLNIVILCRTGEFCIVNCFSAFRCFLMHLQPFCHDCAQPLPRSSQYSDPSPATPKLIAVPQLNSGHYISLQPRTVGYKHIVVVCLLIT